MQSKEIIESRGMDIHFYLDAIDTDKRLTMFKCIISPGAEPTMSHYHDSFDETFYGLKGTATCTVDGRTTEVGPGEALFIPRGAVHSVVNKTNEQIEVLCFTNPGVLGPDYFHDLAAVLAGNGPADIENLKKLMQSHGVIPVVG